MTRPASSGEPSPIFADQHCDAHGEARRHSGEGMHNLAAGGYGGNIGRVAELAHNQQIRRPIGRLEQQSQQHRQSKPAQRRQNRPLCKVSLLFHGVLLSVLRKQARPAKSRIRNGIVPRLIRLVVFQTIRPPTVFYDKRKKDGCQRVSPVGWDWGLTNRDKGRIISLYQGRKPVTQEATPPPQNRKAEK